LTQEEVTPGVFEDSNIDLDATRSQHFVLGYDAKLGADWRAKVEAYYQYIDKVPVDSYESSFSLLNLGEGFGFPDDKIGLVNEGTGSNKGVEITVEKFFSKGYYALLTASLYDSKYKGSDGIERSTAFNNKYVFNVLAGKEFAWGNQKQHRISFDTKLTTAGGKYYTPVDLAASQVSEIQVLDEVRVFEERYDSYFRWDVKVGVKLNNTKRRFSQGIYFDIQNITNNKNIFRKNYNRKTNMINDVYQIGFFPNFMYKIEF